MINLRIDDLDVQAEEGDTILEAARFYGIDIPTLCHDDGLTPYGACRLCVVEIGEGKNAKLASSCTYPAQEGLRVRTHSRRVVNARKMIIELMVARCPNSKTVQDLASKYGIQKVRFKDSSMKISTNIESWLALIFYLLCNVLLVEKFWIFQHGFELGTTKPMLLDTKLFMVV